MRIGMPGEPSSEGRRATGRARFWPRRRWPLLLAATVAALTPAATLAATTRPSWSPGPPWAPLAPASGEMSEISNLFWIMLVISGIVFAVVCFALIYSIINFSGKEGDPDPKQVFGNRRIEILWTLIPTLILLIAFGATVKAISDINTSSGGKILQIRAIGHQWWWEFQYPGLGIETANEVHIPAGTRVQIHIQSYDVIHSFWIPQLTRQIDANPGQDNPVFLTTNKVGVYGGDCYEYCGVAHAWMKFRAVVQGPAQFQAWVKNQQRPAPSNVVASSTASAATIAAGRRVFLSQTCVQCHAIQGTTAGGVVGPNLTHLASRWTIGAGAAPMTKSALVAWIRNPQTFKQGVYMPPYPFLTGKQVSDLADYLLSLK